MRAVCDVAHSKDYTVGRPAAYDLGRYRRVVGLPGLTRYLCADCAVGRISPRHREKFLIGRKPAA